MGHVISANPITCPITLQSDGLKYVWRDEVYDG